MCVWRNTEVRSCNHGCSGRAISVTYSKCVSIALVIQHAKPMRHIVLPSLACPGLQYFSPNYLTNGVIFVKKWLNTECVFWFSLQLRQQRFLILRIIKRGIIINLCRYPCEVPVILFIFWWNVNFLDRVSGNPRLWNLMRIRPVGAELFCVNGRMYMAALTVAFWNFANSSKNV
jgi:hypothetical protein